MVAARPGILFEFAEETVEEAACGVLGIDPVGVEGEGSAEGFAE